MSIRKGQPIVTSLIGALVAPTNMLAWPEDWDCFRSDLAPCYNGVMEVRNAEVVGVYMHDGSVWFLLRNTKDDKLTQSAATLWRVVKKP